MCVDEKELADLTARAEGLGFDIFCYRACAYVLRRIVHETTDPATHSNANLEDLRDMLDGIERGPALGPIRRPAVAAFDAGTAVATGAGRAGVTYTVD